MAEEGSRKRASTRQLTDRDDVDDTVEDGDENGTWKKAEENVIKERKIVKVGRGRAAEPAKANISWNFGASSSSEPSEASKNSTTEEKKNGTESPSPSPSSSSPPSSTPTKDSTTPPTSSPSKSTTPPPPTSSPAKSPSPAFTTTPPKELVPTPTKDSTAPTTTSTTPNSKEENGKTTPPTSAEAPKPAFTFPTAFSFPTSFSATTPSPFTFPGLSTATTPAFSSTTSAPFSGFNFPSVNFSAGGSSVFSAKKEGSDDEAAGEEANPEEEVAITGPSKLPLVAVVTGEEEENTLYSVRAKLYAMAEGKWQERGVGQLKLNQAKDGKCRLLMRDQGGKHLRLNTSIFPEMKVDKSGEKSVQFVALGSGGSDAPPVPSGGQAKAFTTYAARVGRKEEAEELLAAIVKCKSGVSSSSSTSTTTTEST